MRQACLLLLSTAAIFAQTYGEITGNVNDSSGAAIAGAEVTITNLATNQIRQIKTSDSGVYTVPFLVPGRYKLEAKAQGFKAAIAAERVLQVGDTLRVDFDLQVGAVTESVEVAASAEMLQTSNTATGTVIEQRRIVELPLNGRNYLQLVRLAPNVSSEMPAGGQANGRQGGERSNQALSIAGMRQQYNRFTLDGLENTDVNFNTFIVRPSVDALQEFKVQTGVYSAEFGRSPSQINVNTKPGTNEMHGVLFEFLRHDKIQARPWLAAGPKNPFRRNQFGFTVDGPVVIPKVFNGKDKLFFMANFEGLRERVASVRRSTVADAAMIGGDFSAPQNLPIFDPTTIRNGADGRPTATPFANQRIPVSRFSPQFVKLLEFYGAPNVPGAVAGVSQFNYVRNAPSPTDWDQVTSRVDFNESVNSQWFGRLSWGDELLLGGNTFPSQDEKVQTKVWQFMFSNVRTFTPTVVNELRVGASIFDNDKGTALANVRNVTTELNIPGLLSPIPQAWGAPGVGFGGNNFASGWGETTEAPFVVRNRTYQLLDNLNWIRGKHTLKFGGEITSRRFNQIGNQFPRGFFQFPSRYTSNPSDLGRTGSAFATGLLGWTEESTRALGIANTQFRQWAQSFYAEDTWKIRQNLTINIGLRYEYTPPFKDRHRGIFNVQLFCTGVLDGGRALDPNCRVPVLVRPGPGDFHQDLNVHIGDIIPKATGDDVLFGRATVRPDKNDWAPRIGIAWQPGAKWTVRTGYGLFFAQDTINPVWDMARNLGFRETSRSIDLLPNVNINNPWAVLVGTGVRCANWSGLCLAGSYTFSNEVNRRTAYVHQYLLNVQHQLTDAIMVEVGYQGNGGHKLQRMYGWNDPIFRSGPDDNRSANDRRPWGGNIYGRIQTIGGHVNSNYNSGIIKVQQRFNKGYTYLLGYTWSRSIDSGSGIRVNDGDNLFPANNYNFRSERGLSQFHQLHRFTSSALYELPFGKNKRDLGRAGNAVLGGWSLGTILTMSTGSPFNGGGCGDIASNTQGSRGDATGISPYVSNPTPQEYFKRHSSGRGAAAITCTTLDSRGFNELTYREGNISRNVYIGPGVFNWDFSVLRRFDIVERMNLEFRFESFNFTNHPNWGNPDTNLTSLNYGTISGARGMRTNQFGLKLAW
ncbi:MAG: TonB-dependent receptor [Acidobacteria bacterium]|nr:TonB-dependent receptor [Acidobacteriota bacterium]